MTVKGDRPIGGGFVNDSFTTGHKLRDRDAFVLPTQRERTGIVIVGGGIAGLSAAWRLQKRGFTDFVLLEMNREAGGNARWGQNEVSAYPWAAHYVPIPGPKATYVRELFEELGVLQNGQWNERYLCFAPQERLFVHGRWQDGIEPSITLSSEDRRQFARLEDLFAQQRATGAFTVPMEMGLSSGDRGLDQISFADWLRQNGINSPAVLWYMNYCCRDDYGAMASETSAWAGIHYSCSREPDEKGPITWPEGNGWITRRLLERVGKFIRTETMVHSIRHSGQKYLVRAGGTEYSCQAVIFAAPTFLAPYIVEGFPALTSFEYSPWLTANLTLSRAPKGASTGERAWDNVVMDSPTLGYVDATHQTLRTHVEATVWTFYWALAEGPAKENRAKLLSTSWDYWKNAILDDLQRVHPDIRNCVNRVDIMRMGHAMVRPIVGGIFAARRRELARRSGRLVFANSDVSGISIFEEAQYGGVLSADKLLHLIGKN
jgi:predicted NAD/FAD-dependent oxidoreductase